MIVSLNVFKENGEEWSLFKFGYAEECADTNSDRKVLGDDNKRRKLCICHLPGGTISSCDKKADWMEVTYPSIKEMGDSDQFDPYVYGRDIRG